MNEAVLKRAAENLETTMAEYDLTNEEKQALRAGDPRKLRPLGAHGMVSLYILRLNPEFRDNVYWAQK